MTVEMRIGLVHQFMKVVMHVTMRFLCTDNIWLTTQLAKALSYTGKPLVGALALDKEDWRALNLSTGAVTFVGT